MIEINSNNLKDTKLIELSENTTNGDMIKALFPNGVISYGRKRVYYTYNSNGRFDFLKDLWNAPYKKGEQIRKENDNDSK